jgi:glycerol-3-phosphate acyltransferase PlsY
MFVIFVGGSAVATALGRLSAFGIEQSIAARYATPTLYALAALVILIARYLSVRQAGVLFLIIALLLLPRQLTALRSRGAEHAQLEKAMNAVIENRDSEADRRVLGDPEIVERVANRLRAMKIGLWNWKR